MNLAELFTNPTIKASTDEIVEPGAGASVTHAAWFKVVEVRPLV